MIVGSRFDDLERWIVIVVCAIKSPEHRGGSLKNDYPKVEYLWIVFLKDTGIIRNYLAGTNDFLKFLRIPDSNQDLQSSDFG